MKFLLINPPIYDFAAYGLWAKPIGLLKIASVLKKNRLEFYYFDTLDISDLTIKELKKYKIKRKESGRHTYIKKEVLKPECLQNVHRKFYRFGKPEKKIYEYLSDLPTPDYVIITSVMTYWYPGPFEMIKTIKRFFPDSKIILGGIYVNLCFEHAKKYSGADYVVKSIDDICTITGIKKTFNDFLPLEVYRKNYYAPIYTSYGCPFACGYCANKFLNKGFFLRDIDKVFKEIIYYYENFGITDFAFYDDALLVDKDRHFIPLMEKIRQSKLPLRFYCPNGLHVSEITKKTADIMIQSNIIDIRLSLETSNEELQKKIGDKTDNQSFVNAVKYLKQAGFKRDNISVYLLVGLPYQKKEDVINSVKFAKQFDIKVKLAEYSPIPNTLLWKESIKVSQYDILNEPLLHNNKLLPAATKELTWAELNKIKKIAR